MTNALDDGADGPSPPNGRRRYGSKELNLVSGSLLLPHDGQVRSAQCPLSQVHDFIWDSKVTAVSQEVIYR